MLRHNAATEFCRLLTVMLTFFSRQLFSRHLSSSNVCYIFPISPSIYYTIVTILKIYNDN